MARRDPGGRGGVAGAVPAFRQSLVDLAAVAEALASELPQR